VSKRSPVRLTHATGPTFQVAGPAGPGLRCARAEHAKREHGEACARPEVARSESQPRAGTPATGLRFRPQLERGYAVGVRFAQDPA
jgi:hypothetical protein